MGERARSRARSVLAGRRDPPACARRRADATELRCATNERVPQRFLSARLQPGTTSRKLRPGAILYFHDPNVGIEFYLPRQVSFDLRVWRRLTGKARREGPGRSLRRLERALRRRTEQVRSTIEPVDANEKRAGFLGAAAADRAENPLDLTAPQIGGNPKTGFEPHRPHPAGISARESYKYKRYVLRSAIEKRANPCRGGWPAQAAGAPATGSDAPSSPQARSRADPKGVPLPAACARFQISEWPHWWARREFRTGAVGHSQTPTEPAGRPRCAWTSPRRRSRMILWTSQ